MYDRDGDGRISKDDLLSVLSTMVGANISREQLESIAVRTVAEADEDQVEKTFCFDIVDCSSCRTLC
jgi:Ca2+-binding EF-hand superfamily protein